MSIKAVLFDLDDTLWPIVPVIKRAEDILHAWLQVHAPEVAARVSIDGMRRRRQELMAADPVYQLDLRLLRRAVLSEAFLAAGQDTSLVDDAMAVFSRARNEVTPFEDVLPVLGRLRGRVILGSISNGVADLEAIGMAHLFEASIAAWHVGRAKPDPGIFHLACDALGVLPQETLYVGDDPVLDVAGAKNAGLRAAWIRRFSAVDAGLLPDGLRADAIVADLHELERWLNERTMSA